MTPAEAFSAGFLALLAWRGWWFFRAMASGAPYLSTTEDAQRAMLELAEVGEGMTVVDLGSGGGELLLAAAARGARAIGVELDPFLVWWSRLRVRAFAGPGRVEVRRGDLWTAAGGEAAAVFVYLTPGKMERLRASLAPRLKPGALVVSNRFEFPGLEPLRADRRLGVYVYRFASPAA